MRLKCNNDQHVWEALKKQFFVAKIALTPKKAISEIATQSDRRQRKNKFEATSKLFSKKRSANPRFFVCCRPKWQMLNAMKLSWNDESSLLIGTVFASCDQFDSRYLSPPIAFEGGVAQWSSATAHYQLCIFIS